MFCTSSIELDQEAYESNLKFIKSKVGPEVKFSSVVKGNAYGHGVFEFVPMAESSGVDHFSVFSADEALEVLNISMNRSSIMIMGYIDNQEVEWAILNEIEFFVFEIGRLRKAVEVAKKHKLKAKVHIELETGLNRTGFNKKELQGLIKMINQNTDAIEIKGLCTHYAGAESIANYVRVTSQIKLFKHRAAWLNKQGIAAERHHTACSAAAISYPKSRMDMVRVGILQYGFWPSKETFIDCIKPGGTRLDPLKRVIKWKSRVMDVKLVNGGEFIGYGTSYMASDKMKVAIVPVGYSQGYSRSLSNQGRVLIRGRRLAVVGMVNMNLLTVDISECPEVEQGDEVVLIGDQGDQAISVGSFGELSNQLNYELLSRLPRNIPRTVNSNDSFITKSTENGLLKA